MRSSTISATFKRASLTRRRRWNCWPANPKAAGARLQADLERLESLGEQALLATTAAMLAQARFAEGREDEAAELTEVAERAAAREDRATQAIWRGVRAQLLAREGRQSRPRRWPARRSRSSTRPTG